MQVQTALTERRIDNYLLTKAATGRVLCSISSRFLAIFLKLVEEPLNKRIKQFYTLHYFHAIARLDVPTFEDTAVQQQLEQALPKSSRSSIAWDTIVALSNTCFKVLSLVSEFAVLIQVLRDQRDGVLLASIVFAHSVLRWSPQANYITRSAGKFRIG